MGTLIERKVILTLLLAAFLGTSFGSITFIRCIGSTNDNSIELNEFRWNQFPLKVLVDMNQWSLPEYAIAVREALDNWVKSVWNYTHSYLNTTLLMNYIFYVSNTNSTSNYDIVISFTPNEMPPGSRTVGLANYTWNIVTHEPVPPVTIIITTYSATAESLFIKNVVMHEFGHALGLGHAALKSTSNGSELMYYTSSNNEIIYPSTLDVYGLVMLYEGHFGETVQLPIGIPYKMLAEGNIPPPVPTSPLYVFYPSINKLHDIFYQPMTLLFPSIFWLSIALVFGLLLRSGKQGTIVAVLLFVLIAYSLEDWNTYLVSLSLKIVLLLPAIMIGASIGGFIGRKFSRKRMEMPGVDPCSKYVYQ